MNRTTARLTGALLVSTFAIAGCSGDSGHGGMSGMPGSSSATAPAGSADAAAVFDDADVAFARGMLPHHQQAVDMAQLAADRAADPRVADQAARIEAAQGPEIETLSGWLAAWGAEATGSSSTGHGSTGHGSTGHGSPHEGMDGMMSDEDMESLADASGAEFDRMFLEMMIEHHRGATAMAGVELADGRNPDALSMAEDIRDTQTAEIAEMEQLLAELGG